MDLTDQRKFPYSEDIVHQRTTPDSTASKRKGGAKQRTESSKEDLIPRKGVAAKTRNQKIATTAGVNMEGRRKGKKRGSEYITLTRKCPTTKVSRTNASKTNGGRRWRGGKRSFGGFSRLEKKKD